MKITNWKDCIRNRIKWKKLVERPKLLWSYSASRRRRRRRSMYPYIIIL
jgi:hypothetical protein